MLLNQFFVIATFDQIRQKKFFLNETQNTKSFAMVFKWKFVP